MSRLDEVLQCLKDRDRQTVKQIVALSGLPEGTVKPALFRLEQDGLVERDKNQRDTYWVIVNKPHFKVKAEYPAWLELFAK